MSVPAQLGDLYRAGSRAKPQGALALFSLFGGLLSPPELWMLSAARSQVRKKRQGNIGSRIR